jgi:hypothetical protein
MARFMDDWNASDGFNQPGVSEKIICMSSSLRIPRMDSRVVWGLGETMESLTPRRAFNSVDLPTFGQPTIAT